MPEDRSLLPPGFSHDDLAGTAQAEVGAGADEGLPLTTRFRYGVAKVIRRRRATVSLVDDPQLPAIFFLYPSPSGLAVGRPPKGVPMLDNGATAIAGRLWFVSAVCAKGHYVESDSADDEALFSYVVDILDLGTVPAIVFDPRSLVDEARFYPRGLIEPDDYEPLLLGASDLKIEAVFDIVAGVHRTSLITPGAQSPRLKMWSDARRGYPARNAEIVLQTYLRIGLAAVLSAYVIRVEQSMVEGRLDIEIELQDPLPPNAIVRPVIIELKVLRSFSDKGGIVSEADTLAQIDTGVEQAASYRVSRAARQTGLCCFDMRRQDTGDACFGAVRVKAQRVSVQLRRWFLYASAARLRSAQVARI